MVDKDNRSYPHGPGSLWQGPVHSLDGFWFPAFATADAPPASLYPEIVIILTDGGSGGGAALARSDGTDWTAFEGGSGGGQTTVEWSNVNSTPTTLSGYGITDAFSGAYGDLTAVPATFPATPASVTAAVAAKTQIAALAAVNAPDATDLASAQTLANANKAAINDIIAALKA